MPTSGPVGSVEGQGVSVFCSSSTGMGMPVGTGLLACGTQAEIGSGTMAPTMPSVTPFGVFPEPSGGEPVGAVGALAGIMVPPPAREKSSVLVVPYEMLERRLPRLNSPSAPSSSGRQVPGCAW